jgi:hypothetical protein
MGSLDRSAGSCEDFELKMKTSEHEFRAAICQMDKMARLL